MHKPLYFNPNAPSGAERKVIMVRSPWATMSESLFPTWYKVCCPTCQGTPGKFEGNCPLCGQFGYALSSDKPEERHGPPNRVEELYPSRCEGYLVEIAPDGLRTIVEWWRDYSHIG
jgi:hypothetical protein